MTLLYYDPLCLEHKTGAHPERPLRLTTIWEHLETRRLAPRCTRIDAPDLTAPRAEKLHDPKYLAELRRYVAAGGGRIEADTVVSPRSWDAAVRAAGAVVDAVERVVRGEDTSALCLVRPPGHHAVPQRAMGFCLLNNIALGAQAALDELALDRVLIVDFDVHHGNGTQDMFWESDRVGFLSIHRWPFYPGTGASDETGHGRGLGFTVNLPVEFGTPRAEYHARFERALADFARKVRPQLVLVSAGFDAHREDPIGSLELETEDFARLTRAVQAVAKDHCEGRIVSVLEGGYHPDRLAESVATHLRGLLGLPE